MNLSRMFSNSKPQDPVFSGYEYREFSKVPLYWICEYYILSGGLPGPALSIKLDQRQSGFYDCFTGKTAEECNLQIDNGTYESNYLYHVFLRRPRPDYFALPGTVITLMYKLPDRVVREIEDMKRRADLGQLTFEHI